MLWIIGSIVGYFAVAMATCAFFGSTERGRKHAAVTVAMGALWPLSIPFTLLVAATFAPQAIAEARAKRRTAREKEQNDGN